MKFTQIHTNDDISIRIMLNYQIESVCVYAVLYRGVFFFV